MVVSDLRFSDDAGGLRAGQLFVDEAGRVHPEVQGLLYSAYPRPDGFPAERFVRKGGDAAASATEGLAETVVAAVERHLADPAVSAFAAAIADLGIVYQSESFGTTLAQLFDLARLFGAEPSAARRGCPAGRGGPCPACCSTARAAPASAGWPSCSTRRPTAGRRRWSSPRATS